MLAQDILQSRGIEQRIVGDLVNDISQVGEEVALVLVREDGGHAGVVELDGFVVDAHEVHGGVRGHERREGVGDDLGDGALRRRGMLER